MTDKQKSNWWQALSLLGQLGYVIAVPLVILALVGRFFDKKYNSSPWFLITAMFLSLAISTIWVYKKTMQIMGEATDQENPSSGARLTTGQDNKAIKQKNNDNNS